jgi:hypothetical protein
MNAAIQQDQVDSEYLYTSSRKLAEGPIHTNVIEWKAA